MTVLSQERIGSDLPIAYASRTLNVHEQNYSTIEKELLAIVWSVRYFRPYLYGRTFTIVTDHKPLQWLFNLKEPNSKLVRWRLKLEEFDYKIIYKKGASNTNADALSRVELNINEIVQANDSNNDEISSVLAEQGDDQIFDMDQFLNEHYEQMTNVDSECHTDPIPIFTNNIPCATEQPSVNLELQDAHPSHTVTACTSVENSSPLDNDNDNNTVHSNQEDPILCIPTSDSCVNVGYNQIIISLSSTNSHTKVDLTQDLHKNKQRISVQFPKENLEHEITQFVKTYIAPKVKYHLFFKDDFYEKFSKILQHHFSSSQLNFVKCNKFLRHF